jgi:hypothetical protein
MDKFTKNELLNKIYLDKIDLPFDCYYTLANIDSEPILRAVVASKTNLIRVLLLVDVYKKNENDFFKALDIFSKASVSADTEKFVLSLLTDKKLIDAGLSFQYANYLLTIPKEKSFVYEVVSKILCSKYLQNPNLTFTIADFIVKYSTNSVNADYLYKYIMFNDLFIDLSKEEDLNKKLNRGKIVVQAKDDNHFDSVVAYLNHHMTDDEDLVLKAAKSICEAKYNPDAISCLLMYNLHYYDNPEPIFKAVELLGDTENEEATMHMYEIAHKVKLNEFALNVIQVFHDITITKKGIYSQISYGDLQFSCIGGIYDAVMENIIKTNYYKTFNSQRHSNDGVKLVRDKK